MNIQSIYSEFSTKDTCRALTDTHNSSSSAFNRRIRPGSNHLYYDSVNYPQRNMLKSMEEELENAEKIQNGLFPAILPKLEDYELSACNRQACRCGGDYYDVLPTAGASACSAYLFCVADVCGKGLPASLLMSNLQAILRTAIRYHPPMMDLVSDTNRLLYATTPADKFITAILVNCDPITGKCKFVNAGHNGGVLVRSEGTIEILKTTGPPLGMMADMPFFSESLEMCSGDALILYSDGIPESFDSCGEEWGEERFMNCLCKNRHLGSEAIISKVFDEVDRYAENTPQHDDITLLILKRKPNN